ncbi:phosphoribosyl 1,2-cyclic phosphate phosphodiesterase [Parapedobacter composti]|uniref:Phosphoribosyl 1,2-cyclic phosphate phosphodiesterase n=1 Tax=Parapedobacter composti TaxID=623281 RepID=A0A1I1KIJ7_9SPHI|nr:MBL fold metallo-hydrolase [Parapedobacter composti]SFC60637.1 phosphoribosyl 1,2-cyclic phosphate phosphodiesterase [Parapedobacter composti]
MTVRFLGTGTSQGIPVIACNCGVCTSSDPKDKRLRSSVLLQVDGQNIVIDTGPDFRYQMLREKVMRLNAILFTHSHKDHIAGLDDVRAFNRLQERAIDIYGAAEVHEALKREFYYAFGMKKYPGVPELNLHEITSNPFSLAGTNVIPIEVMHYMMPVMGFRIGEFTYITDAKTIPDSEIEKISGTRVLVVNALQREPHISHFTLDEAVAFAHRIGAEQTYFTHISHRLGLHDEVQRGLPEGIALAYDGLVLDGLSAR